MCFCSASLWPSTFPVLIVSLSWPSLGLLLLQVSDSSAGGHRCSVQRSVSMQADIFLRKEGWVTERRNLALCKRPENTHYPVSTGVLHDAAYTTHRHPQGAGLPAGFAPARLQAGNLRARGPGQEAAFLNNSPTSTWWAAGSQLAWWLDWDLAVEDGQRLFCKPPSQSSADPHPNSSLSFLFLRNSCSPLRSFGLWTVESKAQHAHSAFESQQCWSSTKAVCKEETSPGRPSERDSVAPVQP